MRSDFKIPLLGLLALSITGWSGMAWGAPVAKPKDSDFFERHIRPIFVNQCYECHSEAEKEQKGGLLLDRESGWLEGGETGKAVVPGNVAASLLITAVRRADEDTAMPPKAPFECSGG